MAIELPPAAWVGTGVPSQVGSSDEPARTIPPTVIPARVDLHALDALVETATQLLPREGDAVPERPWVWTGVAALPEVAKASLRARLAQLGLSEDGDVVAKVAAAELARARAADAAVAPGGVPRVTEADMALAIERQVKAQLLTPARQNDLFAFTGLIDGKFEVTPELLTELAKELFRVTETPDQFLGAAQQRAANGDFVDRRPHTRHDLLAALVRQMVGASGASLGVTLDEDLSTWLKEFFADRPGLLRLAMGGAGAFCANLAALQPEVRASFYAAEPPPAALADRFGRDVALLDPLGRPHPATEYRADKEARVNYCAEYPAGMAFSLFGRKTLQLDGSKSKRTPMATTDSGRVIFSSPGDVRTSFDGMDDEALRRMGQGLDLFFLSGVQYLSQDAPAECQRKAELLATQLDQLHTRPGRPLVHLEYVVPKKAENEAQVLGALRGHLDSMGLNTVEAFGLLKRLAAAGLCPPPPETTLTPGEAEKLPAVLDAGLALKSAMQLPRVHVHARAGDLLIVDGPVDPEREVLALTKARQLAEMKAANPSGELRLTTDLWPVLPVPDGESLAAVQVFADELALRLGLSPAERDEAARRWYHRDAATGKTYIFAPSRRLYDRRGGATSLGDTIDSTALIYALAPDHGALFDTP